jgi:hypothetical protein
MKGLVRNEDMVTQAIDFAGIENNKIHPSDIDGVLEFNNQLLIIIETKRRGNSIPVGQRLLLERLCDSWHTGKAVVLQVEHGQDKGKIPLHKCTVTSVYYQQNWTNVSRRLLPQLNRIGKYFNESKCFFKDTITN